MDVEKIRKLADYIENDNRSVFFMGNWMIFFNKTDPLDMIRAKSLTETSLPEGFCGTAGCIAGFAYFAFHGIPGRNIVDISTITYLARNELGLGWRQGEELFIPWDYWRRLPSAEKITREHAVKVLRHLADTGKIDWSVAFPEAVRHDDDRW